MDPSPQDNQQMPGQIMIPPAPSSKKIVLIIALLLILALVAGAFIFYPPLKKLIPLSKPAAPIYKIQNQASSGAIAKVGEEFLYQQDIDSEISRYPNPKLVDRKTAIDKLVEDSVILQGAKADGISGAVLDNSIYNSTKKNYIKRLQTIEQIKKTITGQESSISGTVVSIWFNNGKPGPLGYEKGKQLALTKITPLQADVKAKKITAKQAGEAIQNDVSLAGVDTAYKSNAFANFTVNQDQKITFDPGFDAKLRALKPGEVTDVYLASLKDATGAKMDVAYLFGSLDNKAANGKISSFENWLLQKRRAYAVIHY